MEEQRKKLLYDILAEADKMRIEKTWLVSEDELEEHSDIRDSYEFGFLCGYLHCKEQMMKDAFKCKVKVDAGGYPYIPQMELYDYDKDIPLAKEGDRYKVVLIKDE